MFSTIAIVLVALMQPRASVADLGWLAGCWELTRGERHVVEHWSAPEGGTLIGMSRTVVAGKTTEHEFLLIQENAGRLEYVAKPSGQAGATFTSVRVTPTEVVFENLEHDFPKRIIYRRDDGGGSSRRSRARATAEPSASNTPTSQAPALADSTTPV